jgi:hypothetical protein
MDPTPNPSPQGGGEQNGARFNNSLQQLDMIIFKESLV